MFLGVQEGAGEEGGVGVAASPVPGLLTRGESSLKGLSVPRVKQPHLCLCLHTGRTKHPHQPFFYEKCLKEKPQTTQHPKPHHFPLPMPSPFPLFPTASPLPFPVMFELKGCSPLFPGEPSSSRCFPAHLQGYLLACPQGRAWWSQRLWQSIAHPTAFGTSTEGTPWEEHNKLDVNLA